MMFLANFRFFLAISMTIFLCIAQSANTDFPGFVQVDDNLKVYYKLVKTAGGEGALSIKAVYQGLAWIGIGISPDGEMVGGEAVIGQPDAAVSSINPGKYTMKSQSASGVTPMDPSAQTLIDGSITQDATAGVTTLEFTKILQEYYELIISTVGTNTFIYAIGADNTYPSYHGGGRGSFKLDLSAKSVSEAMTTASPTPSAATVSSNSGTLPPTVTKAPVLVALVESGGTATPTYLRYTDGSASGSSTLYPTSSSSISPSPAPNGQLTSATSDSTLAPTVTKSPVSLTSSSGSTTSPLPSDSTASPSPSGGTASPSPSGSKSVYTDYYVNKPMSPTGNTIQTSDGDRYFGTEN